MNEQNNSDKADILIVDDKPENLRLLATILTNQGYEVRKAINGKLCITMVKAALIQSY